MKNLNQLLALALVALGSSSINALAQPDFGNMDPQQMQQQMQQRMMENYREQLVVTNDSEWKVIEERLSKIVRVRMETMFSGMGMMGGMRGGPGGGFPGGGGPGGGFPGFGRPDPDAENLQKTIESNAPTAQIKSALEKLREARKQKQADLAKAREELRKLLTVKQEATLVVSGILD